ncbi:MAG: ACT domain-containing protein [Planctomycetes bacterium]|nr:ACT domain-containing protein [Planctomycetota bacterium]
MSQHVVLTAVGPDKPGLVDGISKFILDCGCNIADSRMAVLGGEFAMLILVEGDAPAVKKVLEGSEGAGARIGLAVQARATAASGGKRQTVPYEIEAYSMDHPGIVQRVAHFLAERHINVRALDTRVTHAPNSGQPLFSLHATVDVPAAENVMEVRRGLETIGAQENIDIELRPAD